MSQHHIILSMSFLLTLYFNNTAKDRQLNWKKYGGSNMSAMR